MSNRSPLLIALALLAIGLGALTSPVTAVPALAGPAEPVAQSPETLKVSVGDVELAYRVWGQGEPLLLITGFRATIDDWDPTLVQALAAHYLVIAFDNRGMGGSTAPPGPFTIAQLADDAVGFLGALGIDRAHVLGYSMGGFVAQELALRYPERVARLMLLSTTCGGPESVPTPPAVWAALTASAADAAERVLAVLLPADWIARNQAYLRALGARPREPVPAESIHRQQQAIEEWPGVCERLRELGAPTLVLAGTLDEVFDPRNAVIVVERIRGAWLAQFSGGGHALLYQYPRALATAIRSFLLAP